MEVLFDPYAQSRVQNMPATPVVLLHACLWPVLRGSIRFMRITVLVTAILVLACSAVTQAKDMQEYLSETRDLVRQGKHEEALERFIWFHNHALEYQPAMYGVRLSFALGYWKHLGNIYPPALEAMQKIRGEKTELLKAGKGDFALFHDVLALNRTLGEAEKTLQLFERIHAEQPERAREFWRVAGDVVFKAKRYDLAQEYVGDLGREFGRINAEYEQNKAFYEDRRIGGPEFRRYNENRLVEGTLKLIGLALAMEDEKTAEELRQKALALVDDPRLRDATLDKSN